jgi:hypothetical protein
VGVVQVKLHITNLAADGDVRLTSDSVSSAKKKVHVVMDCYHYLYCCSHWAK